MAAEVGVTRAFGAVRRGLRKAMRLDGSSKLPADLLVGLSFLPASLSSSLLVFFLTFSLSCVSPFACFGGLFFPYGKWALHLPGQIILLDVSHEGIDPRGCCGSVSLLPVVCSA